LIPWRKEIVAMVALVAEELLWGDEKNNTNNNSKGVALGATGGRTLT
jgi:hypothetical protein